MDEKTQDAVNGALPACAAPQRNTFYRATNEYLLLLEAFFSMTSYRELGEYGAAQVEWSDGLRSRMPACDLAFESSILMQMNTLDMAVSVTLFDTEVADEENPYEKRFGHSYNQIFDLLEPFSNEFSAHSSTWFYRSSMNSCTREELITLGETLQGYLALLNDAASAKGATDFVEFGRALIEWRENSWTRLPSCSEALEIGMVIHQSAGDTIEFSSRDLDWLPKATLEFLEETLGGDARLGQRLEYIVLDRFGRDSRWWRTFESDNSKPTCSGEAIAKIAQVVSGYYEVLNIAKTRNTWSGGLMSYIDARIAWRMDSKESLADCRIRYDLGRLLSQDIVNYLSGKLPILGQLLNQGNWLQTTISALEKEPGTDDTRRLYSSNLRSCDAGRTEKLERQH